MEAPAGRQPRRRPRATSVVLVTTLCAMMFAIPAFAEDPTDPPTDPATTAPPTTDPPTTEPPTTDPPPPPPPTTSNAPAPPTFVPAHNFKMTVGDVQLADAYWQGDGSSELVIALQNTGNVPDTITGSSAFPSGAVPTGTFGADGCNANGVNFSCNLDPNKVGKVVVKVNVDGQAWRTSGAGTVNASLGGTTRTRSFAIVFTTQPPIPGIALSTSKLALPPQSTPKVEAVDLVVKLGNTGAAKGGGAVEVVTPPGVDLVGFPTACKSHRRIAADRDRCEFGDVLAGKDVSATFGLSVSVAARAEAPLTGAVHGYLTPVSLNMIETRSDYQITAPALPGEAPLSTDAPPSPAASGPAAPGAGAPPGKAPRADGGLLTSNRLAILPIVGGIIGLVAVVGLAVVLSLRRRMRDDEEPDGPAEKVKVPAQRSTVDELEEVPVAIPRSPFPRALTLPRLPAGPVAGPAFREAEED